MTTTQETIESWKWRGVRLKMNQAELAAFAGYTPSAFSEILSGKKNITAARFDQIEADLQAAEIKAGVRDAAR